MTARPATGTGSPSSLSLGRTAWRDLLRGGHPRPADPDATSAALVRAWHQHFAVAIDGPMERAASGSERLPELVHAWLDLARRTAPVRAYVAEHAGPRSTAEQRRQAALLGGLLAEDLGLLGVAAPQRRAAGLVDELGVVAAAEDRAGRRLEASRAALLRSVGLQPRTPPATCLVQRLTGWLHPSATG